MVGMNRNTQLLKWILFIWILAAWSPASFAGQPNVVLSRALHFPAPDGSSVALSPGKYFIEQAGSSELRLTPDGEKSSMGFIIHAEALTHEQYELFSPMAWTRPRKNEEYLIELLMPGGIRLEAIGSIHPPALNTQTVVVPQPPSTEEGSAPAIPVTPIVPSEPPVVVSPTPATTGDAEHPPSSSNEPLVASTSIFSYQPPSLTSGGKRIIVDKQDPGNGPIFLSVLSPDHTGLTMFEQPALFWFIGNPSEHPLDVMITDEGNTQVLLDIRLLPPIRPGIHKVDLKDYGIKLRHDTTYQWKVMLQGETGGESLITSGWIMRITPPPNLVHLTEHSTLNSVPLEQLAEAGLWYDAFWALSERIQNNDPKEPFLEQRASLLEQVGLLPPAQLDRANRQIP